jgi:hypothetical protein
MHTRHVRRMRCTCAIRCGRYTCPIPCPCKRTPGFDQLVRGKPAIELADGEGRPIDGRRSAYDGYSGPVWQTRIQDRILAGKVLSEEARDPLNCGLQPVTRVRGRQRNMLNDPSTIRIDTGGAIDHQVGYGRVEQKLAQLIGKERQY